MFSVTLRVIFFLVIAFLVIAFLEISFLTTTFLAMAVFVVECAPLVEIAEINGVVRPTQAVFVVADCP